METATLTNEELLEFEAAHPGIGGAKNSLIRTSLKMHPARYYQRLTNYARTAEALAADAITAHRILNIAA